jgi:hypothetical protein
MAGKKANTYRGERYSRAAVLMATPHFPRENLDCGRGPRSRRSRTQRMVIQYEVMMEPVAREKMALSAVELPILMREISKAKTRDTRSAVTGISCESFDYELLV